MNTYRVVRAKYKGELFHPVLSSEGKMLGPDKLQALAKTPCAHHGTRKIVFCVADESPLRNGRSGLRQQHLQIPQEGLSLTFLDTKLEIGAIINATVYPPGAIPEMQGSSLIAMASLHETALADIAWSALERRLFGGVCPVVIYEERGQDGLFLSGILQYTILGDLESSCIPTARVLALREDPKTPDGVGITVVLPASPVQQSA